MKIKINKLFAIFLLMFVLFTMFPINSFASDCDWSTIKDEVEYFYEQSINGPDFFKMIKGSGSAYPQDDIDIAEQEANIAKHKYSVTYVTQGNAICNLYLDEIPSSYGIWNTNIVVNEGRVVVTGGNNNNISAWNLIYEKYRMFIVGIAGGGAITCVLAFVLFFIKMGANAGNPGERSKTLTMLLFTGAGAAGLGAVTIIFGIFWNIV